MAIEVVRMVEASMSDVVNRCRAIADHLGWKVIADDPDRGSLTFRTPMSWRSSGSYHIDVYIQPHGNFALFTIWTGRAWGVDLDVTREGARIARRFADTLLRELQE
jgi:hypothetical protein